MSIDTEHQEVALALMEEEKQPSAKVTQPSKSGCSMKNYCTTDYLIRFGVPIIIAILIIALFVLAIIYVRNYNQNCAPTKGVSCRGKLWFFT